MSGPLVSVIMPIYMVEPYIAPCLESVLRQTYSNFELICVDDCGGDGSWNIVREYQIRDPRIRLVSHPENRGAGAAKNTGIAHAGGKYIMFVDSDDLVSPTFIEEMVAAAEQSGASCVRCLFCIFDEASGSEHPTAISLIDGVHEMTEELAAELNATACDKLFSADLIRRYDLRFGEGLLYDDLVFWTKACCVIERMYQINKPLYTYRQRPGSTMSATRRGEGRCRDLFLSCRMLYEFLERQGLFAERRQYLLASYRHVFEAFVFDHNYKEEMLTLAKEMLPKIGFPERYDTRETHSINAMFFVKYQKSRFMRIKYKIASALSKLLPTRRLRTKGRAWAQVKYLANKNE